jgi:hypothetical protein
MILKSVNILRVLVRSLILRDGIRSRYAVSELFIPILRDSKIYFLTLSILPLVTLLNQYTPLQCIFEYPLKVQQIKVWIFVVSYR